jgi:hypothetical protein
MHSRRFSTLALCGVLAACGGSSSGAIGGTAESDGSGSSGGSSSIGDASSFGAQYQGNGVQCGAIVCSGTQQCCLVYIAAEASTSNPTHACDQDCESVCAETCPDAGGQTSAGMPPGGGGPPGGPMSDAMAGKGAPMNAMGAPDMMADAMAGAPMNTMGPGPANDAAPDPGKP